MRSVHAVYVFGCQVSGVGKKNLIPRVNIESEPQNIEYRTAECRMVESLCSFFLKRQNTLNPKSAFQNLKFAF